MHVSSTLSISHHSLIIILLFSCNKQPTQQASEYSQFLPPAGIVTMLDFEYDCSNAGTERFRNILTPETLQKIFSPSQDPEDRQIGYLRQRIFLTAICLKDTQAFKNAFALWTVNTKLSTIAEERILKLFNYHRVIYEDTGVIDLFTRIYIRGEAWSAREQSTYDYQLPSLGLYIRRNHHQFNGENIDVYLDRGLWKFAPENRKGVIARLASCRIKLEKCYFGETKALPEPFRL